MVKCKLALKEQPTEEGLTPAVLPGLDVRVRRHQERGWLKVSLCLSACGQGISRKGPGRSITRQYHDVDEGLYGEGAFIVAKAHLSYLCCQQQQAGLAGGGPSCPGLLPTARPYWNTSEHQGARKTWDAPVDPLLCGCTFWATQGKRGSRRRSCRQLPPLPRLNKGRPPQPRRSHRQAALTSGTGRETYPLQPGMLAQAGVLQGWVHEAGKSQVIVSDRERQGKGKEQV